MARVTVVVWIALVACDRGASKSPSAVPPPPAASDATASAPADSPSTPVGDAGVVDAAIVDAIVLAPPKAAAAQKRDCAKAAELIENPKHENDTETREEVAAVKKACIEAPWSATVIDCALGAKGDDNPYDCTLMLPPDQDKAWHKVTKEIFCRYNDCIPEGFTPRPPGGSDDDGLPL